MEHISASVSRVVKFTFTILDEGEAAYSCEGNHCLAIIKGAEDYDSLFKALADLRQEVESLTKLTIDEEEYNIYIYTNISWQVTGYF